MAARKEEKKEDIEVITAIYKVNLHCKECGSKIKKHLTITQGMNIIYKYFFYALIFFVIMTLVWNINWVDWNMIGHTPIDYSAVFPLKYVFRRGWYL